MCISRDESWLSGLKFLTFFFVFINKDNPSKLNTYRIIKVKNVIMNAGSELVIYVFVTVKHINLLIF